MSRGTVLVTGTSSGIGRATALHLATLGFEVVAGVRREEDGSAVRALSPERIEPIVLDVTRPDQVRSAYERASQSGLAGLVNNAGVSVQGPVEFLSLDELRRQLEINFVGQVAVTQAMLPLLRASKGRIVMVSSIGGRLALPFVSPYNASKFALEALSDSLRMELAPLGVGVSIIEPGSVKTEIWRKGTDAGAEMLAALPAEGRTIYGKRLEGLMEAARKTAARGVEPIEVAEAIAHALTARRPKPRYVIGSDAKARLALSRIVSTRTLDSLTARLSGTR